MKTLGILITSDQCPQHILPMVRAAHARGLTVHMHLTGAGVCLIPTINLDVIKKLARITICRDSAAFHKIHSRIHEVYDPMMIRAGQLADIISQWDRHVVL